MSFYSTVNSDSKRFDRSTKDWYYRLGVELIDFKLKMAPSNNSHLPKKFIVMGGFFKQPMTINFFVARDIYSYDFDKKEVIFFRIYKLNKKYLFLSQIGK